MKTNTVIKPCSCSNEFQDRTYGVGKRVWNRHTNTDGGTCTACGREVTGWGMELKKGKKK